MNVERAEAPPKSVLVVDDDPTVALMAKMGLAEHGFLIRSVTSGDAAIAAVETAPPDVILLDVLMPGMNGFEVCRRVRTLPTGRQIPIVIATGLDDSESIERAYSDGATAFVNKPINWPLLRHQLRCILRASGDRARLAESEERYALAAAGANDGLWDWNISEQRVYFSPRWREQLKLRESEIGEQMDAWLARIHPDDQLGFRNELNAHLAGDIPKLEVEYRILDRDGDYRWMLCRALAIRDEDGQAYRIAGSQTDITERKQTEERLAHDALHDALTGLANRKLLLERITHSIKLAQRRHHYRFAVAVLDLDRFKCINESLGHRAGDSLIRRVAERIGGHLRASDTLARIGGDEFAILFDDSGEVADLDRLVSRIQREIAQPSVLVNQEVATSASAGIALHAPHYERAEDMLRDAEIAMYHAKGKGRNQHVVFDNGMHDEVSSLLEMEVALRAAVPRQELVLYYQPISRLDDDRIVGLEALLRWQHPQRGLLNPDAFLRVAEESGLIIAIGQWTLREATRQLAGWLAALPQLGDLFVSVNVSNAQFVHPDLVAQVKGALQRTGLEPGRLKLEVTETALIDGTQQATAVLEQLRACGVATAIDDFGSGYCSFNYLHRFSFDSLKIDKAFTQTIDRDPKSREIVRAIVGLAHSLELGIIAEGAETTAAVQCLRELGCDFQQGFAFSRPLSADAVEDLLRSRLPQLPDARHVRHP